MDVKDITNSKVDGEKTLRSDKFSRLKSNKVSGGQASAVSSDAPVKLNVLTGGRAPFSDPSGTRAATNSIIGVVNVATEATSDIDKLVKSLNGIVQQANKGELPERRVNALEKEGNELVSKIKEIAHSSSSSTSALPDSEIRKEIERKIGKALDAILPEEARDAFGIGAIKLSTKDNIIATLANVEVARNRLEKLREKVTQTRKDVESVVTTLDVAQANSESSTATIRDVDQAAKLVSEVRGTIFGNPDGALKSVGVLSNDVLELLK